MLLERMDSDKARGAYARSQSPHIRRTYPETQLRDPPQRNSSTACQRCRDQKVRISVILCGSPTGIAKESANLCLNLPAKM